MDVCELRTILYSACVTNNVVYDISGIVSQFPGIQIVNEKARSVDYFDIMAHALYVFECKSMCQNDTLLTPFTVVDAQCVNKHVKFRWIVGHKENAFGLLLFSIWGLVNYWRV